ncbi:hypothetical protein ELS19_14720 [Halogeometricum borinquense]|nr:hypothetical protein [Halogeometricum borinquense]RYJ15074.1 hypothetical protein ELS19_14720 [Halogeometricum borinquense]
MANPQGIIFVILGLPMALLPYRLARFEERLDSLGSKRSWSEVEPSDWKVLFNRVGGAALALFGFAWFLLG